MRLDAGYAEGDVVTPYYDPMIAKLIVSGRTRAEAIAPRRRARSSDFDIEGIKHNIPLHLRIVRDAPSRTARSTPTFSRAPRRSPD